MCLYTAPELAGNEDKQENEMEISARYFLKLHDIKPSKYKSDQC